MFQTETGIIGKVNRVKKTCFMMTQMNIQSDKYISYFFQFMKPFWTLLKECAQYNPKWNPLNQSSWNCARFLMRLIKKFVSVSQGLLYQLASANGLYHALAILVIFSI